jgi:predicted HD superfamily hydrolase involved in NAD metabolism
VTAEQGKTSSLLTRIRAGLASRLTPDRLAHVFGVEGLAVILALRHGVDPEKVLLAAVLHDYCKAELKTTLLRGIESAADFPPTAEDREHPAMWHGLAATGLARSEFGVTDPEILEAIAWHTTGRPGLGPVGLTLYVADFLEPTRNFPDVSQARREILPMPLYHAAHAVCVRKIASIERKNQLLHSKTVDMRDWLEQTIRKEG